MRLINLSFFMKFIILLSVFFSLLSCTRQVPKGKINISIDKSVATNLSAKARIDYLKRHGQLNNLSKARMAGINQTSDLNYVAINIVGDGMDTRAEALAVDSDHNVAETTKEFLGIESGSNRQVKVIAIVGIDTSNSSNSFMPEDFWQTVCWRKNGCWCG